jgi:glycosyltransferase involved in cell wall biosynthesis
MRPGLVSVVVPVYNGEGCLAHALESVLAQSTPPGEIIVIDDGSTDATTQAAARYAQWITLIRQSNQGPSVARNSGIARAKGAVVAFLDADDVWKPDALKNHLEALTDDPAAVGAWGLSCFAVAPGAKPPSDNLECKPQLVLSVSSMAFYTSVLKECGGFAVDMRYSEDLDLLVRLEEAELRLARHPNVVVERRLHLNNLTRDEVQTERGRFVVLKRAYDRRRALAAAAAAS